MALNIWSGVCDLLVFTLPNRPRPKFAVNKPILGDKELYKNTNLV